MSGHIDRLLATQQGPNILGAFNEGLQNRDLQQLNAIKLAQAQNNVPLQQAAAQNRLQQQEQNLALNKQKLVQGEQNISAAERKADEQKILRFSTLINENTTPEELQNIVGQSTFLTESDKRQALEFGVNGIIKIAEQIQGNKGSTARQRELESLTAGLSSEDAERARRIKLGLDPRAIGSSSQTIANLGTSEFVGDSEAIVEERRKFGGASGESRARLKFKPLIEKAVTEARIKAKEEGTIFNELSRSKAALPGLSNVVDQLRQLTPIATSTIGGNIFDQAVKQTGFGSTKGATAKAKFIAIINNQVLPLLKETFGAAFTVQEGESLKATMGDPDASPDEKMAQLDAFIAQKTRDIETKQTQLEEFNVGSSLQNERASQNNLNLSDLGSMTPEQLQALRSQFQGQ